MLLSKLPMRMNAAQLFEEPLETIRIMPVPPTEVRLEIDFSIENFEVPISRSVIAEPRPSPDPDSATPVSFSVLVTSRLTASETLCVRKTLKP